VEVQQKEILRQQEIVRKTCEKEGLGFYSGVTMFKVSTVQSLYPEMELTPASLCSLSLVAKLNHAIQEGKISTDLSLEGR
jgi:hypothetical protein